MEESPSEEGMVDDIGEMGDQGEKMASSLANVEPLSPPSQVHSLMDLKAPCNGPFLNLDGETMEVDQLQPIHGATMSETDNVAESPHHLEKLEEGCLTQSPLTLAHGIGEGSVPLWVKWRGKWQAGIQCSLEDCPAQTLKGMPTYGRKSYIVVFFPNNRTFVWTDWQLVCPISENPEPLAFGTHESGRSCIIDLNAARQHMLRKIASALLDISDRLPVQAVVDCARDVSFWKDFAKDAAKAVTYQELGALLLKLKNMILPSFMKETWAISCIEGWEHQCMSIETAGDVEKLAKELKSAVVWDDIGKVWDEVEQTNLDSEWTTWKEDANGDHPDQANVGGAAVNHRRPFDQIHGTPEGGESERPGDASDGHGKRLKLDGQDLSRPSEVPMQDHGINMNTYILAVADGAHNSPARRSTLSTVGGESIEKLKGKLPTVDAGQDDSSPVFCSGTTKHGRRCTHKAKDGSPFCLKHMQQNSTGLLDGVNHKLSPAPDLRNTKAKPSGLQETDSISTRSRRLESSGSHQTSQECLKSASKIAARFGNGGVQCVGWSRKSGSQCSHRAKLGFSHCEKHLPTSMKGQERAVLTTSRPLNDVKETCLFNLNKLVSEYMSVRLADNAAQSSQHPHVCQSILDRISSQADANVEASETLCSSIMVEMESLKKYFEEEDASDVQTPLAPPVSTTFMEQGSYSVATGEDVRSLEKLSNVELLKQVSITPITHLSRFRCKLCAQEFVELVVLGQHWRGCHKKEAQQYFRGYTCQHCNLSFTNKKGLYRHRNAHHPGMASQSKAPLVALCIICNRQFMNFEDLWQHVVCSHADQLCAFWDPCHGAPGATPDQIRQSAVDLGGSADCHQSFSTSAELQQHQEGSHGVHGLVLESPPKAPGAMEEQLKYKCKVCGLRFRLLPDLGRHHQAKHKPAQIMHVKSQKGVMPLSGPPLEEVNSMMGGEKEKKRLQKLDVRRGPGGATKVGAQQNGQHMVPNFTAIDAYTGPKLECCPSSEDILAVARSACCKNKLFSVLLKKYTQLPDRLALKAAKLCSEANVRLEFYREGYVCPNGCQDLASLSIDSKPGPDLPFSNVNSFTSLPPFKQPLLEPLKSEGVILDESHVVFTSVREGPGDKTVLCEDLSFGKERVPIPCVVDRDVMGPCSCSLCVNNPCGHTEVVMPWLSFNYVIERTLDPSLGLDTESSRLGCSCQGRHCLPGRCEHVYLFDNDNVDAQDIYGQPMAGRFPYDSKRCIILEEGYLVYECNSICCCEEDCQNRVLQKGVQVKLEVYKTRHKGWAVRAAQRIPRGTFVCEYIGEVLDDCEANKRGERYDKEGCSYLYDIDAHIHMGRRGRSKPFVIDATKFGNVARFINHSCSPNLVNYQVLVESMDCQLAHIGLYATRDINVGEELAYDYRYKLLPGKGCPCHCGARDCRGRLY